MIRCPFCLGYDTKYRTVRYWVEITANEVVHRFLIPELDLPFCCDCGKYIFDGTEAACEDAGAEVEYLIDNLLAKHLESGNCRCAENSGRDS